MSNLCSKKWFPPYYSLVCVVSSVRRPKQVFYNVNVQFKKSFETLRTAAYIHKHGNEVIIILESLQSLS